MASRVDGSDAEPKIHVPPLTAAGPLALGLAAAADPSLGAAALGAGAVLADGLRGGGARARRERQHGGRDERAYP